MHNRSQYQVPPGSDFSAYNPSSPVKGSHGGGYASSHGNASDTPFWVVITGVVAAVCVLVMIGVTVVYYQDSGEYDEINWDECAIEDEPCSENGDCCSRLCLHQVCVCRDMQEICDRDENCCHSECVNGKCDYRECKDEGEPCSAGNDCCSGECANGICLGFDDVEECADVGNTCAEDQECCSFVCARNVCIDCMEKNEACARDEECCNTMCNKQTKTCENCNTEGDSCRSNDDCCSKKCHDDFCVYHDFEWDEAAEHHDDGWEDPSEQVHADYDHAEAAEYGEGGEHHYQDEGPNY